MAGAHRTLTSFQLEDFFDRYEHEEGLINLASSDALPWDGASLRAAGVELPDMQTLTFGYPDVRGKLLPVLTTFCNLPPGFGLLPTSGAAEAIAIIMQHGAVARSKESTWGLPTPTYGAFVGLANAHGVPVKTYAYQPKLGWKPDLDQIRDLSKECSVLVVVNPHNPTGHTVDERFMRELASEMRARGSLLVVDEVFRERGGPSSAVELGENVIVIGSLSKTYGFPGLRLGWIAAEDKRLLGLRTVQQYLTLSPSSMTVAIAQAILSNPEKVSRSSLIRSNRSVVFDWAKTMNHVAWVSEAQGGTTLCLTLKMPIPEDALFSEFHRKRVLLVPGTQGFNFSPGPSWFRIGYCTSMSKLNQGLEKIGSVLAMHS